MNIFINILVAIICLILGYIFGSIPTGVWIGKVFFHRDPRLEGSKNSGGTNVGRLFGKKVGLLVIILDMIKLIIPVWVAFLVVTYAKFGGQNLCPKPREFSNLGFNFDYIIPWPVYWMAALGCSIGHCWPVFASFKGGKGVSVFAGIAAGTSWLVGFLPGLSFFLWLKLSKKVSLSSIITAVLLTFTSWIWTILVMTNVISGELIFLPMYGATLFPGFVSSIVITLTAIILIVRHKENIQRLKNGTERTITWMK